MIRFYKSPCWHFALIFLPGFVLHTSTLALPSDSEQVIQFSSDRLEIDEVKKTQTYSGSVEMQQGSLKIFAEKVVIYREGNRTSQIVATGQPARYSQIAQPGEEPIIAKARRMEYDIEGKTLQLIDNASIVQRGTSLSGNKIDYDVQRSLVKAQGDGKGGEDDRVRMVIPPEQKKEDQP